MQHFKIHNNAMKLHNQEFAGGVQYVYTHFQNT